MRNRHGCSRRLMITHVMPLAEIDNAFELMKRGESIRGVVRC
jgi:Zn-dependent alcohol dehydrogenase